ncbi:unnamed protein product [Rotaria sp. Silwood1]|nr:unnamed protein product [Rotaria sp. Silwood1]CAF1270049.1 unnamed protein product [Rotaria sp. Silwood1]
MSTICTIFDWSTGNFNSLEPLIILSSVALIIHSIFWIQVLTWSSLRQRNMMWLYAYLITSFLLLLRFFILYGIRQSAMCLFITPRTVLCYFEASWKFYINTIQSYLLLAFNICRYMHIVYNRNIYKEKPHLIIFMHFLIYIIPALNLIVQFLTNWTQIRRGTDESCDIIYLSLTVQIFNLFVIYIIPLVINIIILCLGIRHVSSIQGVISQQVILRRRRRQRTLLLKAIAFYSIWLVLWSPDTLAGQFIDVNSDPVDVCSVWSNDWKHSIELKELIYTSVKPLGGSTAGKYSKIKVESWTECVAQCCQFNRCNVAYWISSTCLHIECLSDELCKPISIDNDDTNDETLYIKVRSVRSTAAALDYDDPGADECNETKLCPINEQCEQVSINAQIKRKICLCDHNNDFRRIKGVCRQYLPHAKPCAIYEIDDENNDIVNDDDDDRGRCKKNEECLPPSDRAKHGYCQCKFGFLRKDVNRQCVIDKQTNLTTISLISSTKSTSISSLYDFEVQAGDDQTIILPKNEIDLSGHILYKSNKSEVDISILKNQNFNLFWSLKSSTNDAKVDISNQENLATHILVKQLREGIYEFELKLNDKQGTTLASDIVKIEVLPTKPTPSPLIVKVPSLVTIRLPQQVTKLQASVEPSNRQVTYQWIYKNDGPTTPTLENINTSDLLISNLRPGNYSFRLDVTDNIGNQQTKTIQLIAIGEPIEARVVNHREIVFWPSNDVILDGTPSIIEPKTYVFWTLISNDNKQDADKIDIVSPHSLKTQVSNLRIGQYKFLLTLVTNDKQYTSKIEVLVIVYSQNGQPPKISIHLETNYVNILNNLIILNATATTADYGISKWQWIKSPLSPAMSYFINNSNILPIAYITNLIEGQYIFILQVYDDRQQMSEMNITVNVNGIPNEENLIEIIFLSKPYLHQQTLDNLLAQIRVFLIDLLPNIEIIMIGMLKENILLIKGKDIKTNQIISPKIIVNHLQDKIKSLRSASNMDILSIDTYLCLSNCSNHGKCDQKTKSCICNKYYMENWFKSLIYREPNCDFIIHYFVLITSASTVLTILFCWLCLCCCLRWRRRRNLLDRRKRIRYQLLHENDEEDDDESSQSLKEKSKNKFHSSKKNKTKISNLIISESENDQSDENGEQTLYDKPLLTAKSQINSPKIKSRGLKVAVQDSSGSPMLRDNRQSPMTSEHTIA